MLSHPRCHIVTTLLDKDKQQPSCSHAEEIQFSASALYTVFTMASEQKAPPAYFAGWPSKFQKNADVMLHLREGVLLPAHSQILACTSPVLCDMLDIGARGPLAGSNIVLPLDDFSESEVVGALKARVCRQAPDAPHCVLS